MVYKHLIQIDKKIEQTLIDAFNNIVGEELGMLSQKLKKDIQLSDIWSVSYKRVTIIHHTIMVLLV